MSKKIKIPSDIEKLRLLNKLGKDAKLFHCTNDNIYFYISKKECEIDDEVYAFKKKLMEENKKVKNGK